MDPLTALLFSLWIAGYFTRNVYEDAVFKARGEDPPSYRRQQQRWERQQQRRDRGPGPARKVFANVWADAWAQADERRSRRVEKAAQARRSKDAEKDMAAAEDEAYEVNDRLNAAEKRTPAPAWDATPPPADTEPAPTPAPSDTPPADQPTTTSPSDEDEPATGQVDAPAKRPAPAPAPAVGPDDAEIIQFADWQRPAASTPTKENTMSAEITGLRSAIAFAEGSSTSATEAVTQTELAIANLQAGGTSGDAITALQQAMDQLTAAATAFQSAQQTLTQQLQVTEAYAANQGAGSREFVKSE